MEADLVMKYHHGQRHLQPTLEEYLRRVDFDPKENPNILDIGCGNNCIGEALPLLKLYKERFNLLARLTCVDRTPQEYAIAQRALGDLARFIPGDAQNIHELVQGEYGLIVVRHPNPDVSTKQKNAWHCILSNSKKVLSPRGLVFMTHMAEVGYVNLFALLHGNGYKVLVSEENPHCGPRLDVEGSEVQCFDKYVLIGQKNGL